MADDAQHDAVPARPAGPKDPDPMEGAPENRMPAVGGSRTFEEMEAHALDHRERTEAAEADERRDARGRERARLVRAIGDAEEALAAARAALRAHDAAPQV